MKKNPLTDKERILYKKKIQEYCKEFKDFTGWVDMPVLSDKNINIVNFKNELGEPVARIIPIDKSNRIFNLNIDWCLYKFSSSLKPVLFHEFTHIMDYSTMFLDRSDQEILIKLYSEYHASQLQMKAMLEFLNINDNMNISLNNEIIDVNTTKTVKRFFLDRREEIISILLTSDLYDKDKLRSNTYNLLYYVGLLSVLQKHCKEDLKEISDVNIFIEKYGNELKEILLNLEIYDFEYNTPKIKEKILISIMADYFRIMKKYNT